MRKPAGQVRNQYHDGHCVDCGVWVDVNEGWISTPYDKRLGPTPLRCVACHGVFRALDQAMTSRED